jgi:hypothetical protein
MTGLTAFVLPFVYPYYRATVYSGDRIAYACCGDLDVSLQAVYRALVGKEVAPHLRADGLVGQALSARRRRVLRLAQLLRPTPHSTNRYLNLLSFARDRTPNAFAEHRPALGASGSEAEPVLARLSRGRAHRSAPAIGITLAALIVLAGLLTGLAIRNAPVAVTLAGVYDAATSSGGTSNPNAKPSPSPETPSAATPSGPTPSATSPSGTTPSGSAPSRAAVGAQLIALVPARIRPLCHVDDVTASAEIVASITCRLTGSEPNGLSLYAYTTGAAMTAGFNSYAGVLPNGSCASGGNRQGTWTVASVTQGPMACYVSKAGDTTLVWGSTSKAVLARAYDGDLTASQMYKWWLNQGPSLQ